MRYVAEITRGTETVASEVFEAEEDEDGFAQGVAWATSLNFDPDDDVWLKVKDPNDAFRVFERKDF